MPAYVIAQMQVHDVETYRKYAMQVGPTVAPFGGRILLAADDAVVLEGTQPYRRIVIGEFPTVEAARQWYESPAYQAIQPLRAASSTGTVFITEGLAVPSTPSGAPKTAGGE
jgi:uncharacterized protein (DUF1330 family)